MNLKKLVPRKKLVYGFGLGFVSFFIILYEIFHSFAEQNLISNQLFFQGKNISNNGSLIFPSFSFGIISPSLNATYTPLTIRVDSNEGIVKLVGLDPNFDSRNHKHEVLKKESQEKVFQSSRNYCSSFEEYDIFDGKLVRDDTKPYYSPGSCLYVDGVFNCYHYKRPDNKFVKWRWQPFGCEIPR